MFDRLGYFSKELKDKWNRVYGIEYINRKKWIRIYIDFRDEDVLCTGLGDDEFYNNCEPMYISIDELKAINKKCKEMGWL